MLNLDGVSHNMYLHQIGSNNQINIKTIKYDTKQGNGMHIHIIQKVGDRGHTWIA